MGLEGVEIVMKVEETFDIVIEDSEAEKSVTPGLLIDLVLSKVGRTEHAVCLTQRAFHRLRASLMRRLNFKRDQIRVETLLESLFPRSMRKAQLRQTLGDIGVRKEFEFVRPRWLECLIWATMLFGSIAVAVYFEWHPISSESTLMNFVIGSPILAGALYFVAVGWLAYFVTRWMRIEFRHTVTSIGQLSRWIVANAPDIVNAPPGQWGRDQVAQIIRPIVIDILGCEKEYREDADFVKDLGMG